MANINDREFKKQYRKDVCSRCPKRRPCALADSICELVTPCFVCEIRDTCKSLCPQMRSYLNRGSKPEVKTVPLHINDRSEGYYSFKLEKSRNETIIEREGIDFNEIPFGILSERDIQIIKAHFIEDKTYQEIAAEMGLATQTVFSALRGGDGRKGALETLKEFYEYKLLVKKYGKYLSPKHKNVLESYYVRLIKPKEMKKVDETIQNVYKRIRKAKLLLDKFKEAELMEIFNE